jgi:hypothetical protein
MKGIGLLPRRNGARPLFSCSSSDSRPYNYLLRLTEARCPRQLECEVRHPYIASMRAHLAEAGGKSVFDKFHIAKHLGEAVDRVRRRENKTLQAADDDRLAGTRRDPRRRGDRRTGCAPPRHLHRPHGSSVLRTGSCSFMTSVSTVSEGAGNGCSIESRPIEAAGPGRRKNCWGKRLDKPVAFRESDERRSQQ